MAQIEITDAIAYEGNAYQYAMEDGVGTYLVPCIEAHTADGGTFTFPNEVHTTWDDRGGAGLHARFDIMKGHEIAAEVKRRGWIDGDHWQDVTGFVDTRSYEQKCDDEYERECMERAGWR